VGRFSSDDFKDGGEVLLTLYGRADLEEGSVFDIPHGFARKGAFPASIFSGRSLEEISENHPNPPFPLDFPTLLIPRSNNYATPRKK